MPYTYFTISVAICTGSIAFMSCEDMFTDITIGAGHNPLTPIANTSRSFNGCMYIGFIIGKHICGRGVGVITGGTSKPSDQYAGISVTNVALTKYTNQYS